MAAEDVFTPAYRSLVDDVPEETPITVIVRTGNLKPLRDEAEAAHGALLTE